MFLNIYLKAPNENRLCPRIPDISIQYFFEFEYFEMDLYSKDNELIYSGFNFGTKFSCANREAYLSKKSGQKILIHNILLRYPDSSIKEFVMDTIYVK